MTDSRRPPVDRAPAVTVVVLDADAPNLTARLMAVAAQDYPGPVEVFAAAARNVEAARGALADMPWVVLLPKAASAGAALEEALTLARGAHIAILPRDARPHALWIAELVAASLAEPRAFAVAPVLEGARGVLAAAGASRGDDGTWQGRSVDAPAKLVNGREAKAKRRDGAWIDAALGDGLLIGRARLAACLPLDPELDARALGIDLSLRARARGERLLLAPRARVEVPTTGGPLRLDPESRALLTAAHEPARLATVLANAQELAEEAPSHAARWLVKVLTRAEIGDAAAAAKLFAKTLAIAASAAREAAAHGRLLSARVAELEREAEAARAAMHKEMAWAHELDARVHGLERALEDAQRSAAEAAAAASAEAEARERAHSEERSALALRLSSTEAARRAAAADLEQARARGAELEATLTKVSTEFEASRAEARARAAELARALAQLAETAERLEGEHAAHAATRALLGDRTAERDAARLRGDRLEEELSRERAAHAAARAVVKGLRVELDTWKSAHAERTSDLARLRREWLAERDLAAERIVGLIEESRRRRWRARRLAPWEVEFLEGLGAGYVRHPIR